MLRPPRTTFAVMLGLLVSQLAAAEGPQAAPSTGEAPPAASVAAPLVPAVENESQASADVRSQIGAMSGRVQYVGPDTYILLDAEGRPQPVPGMTYEDFLAAWKKSQQPSQPNRQPRFTIENIEIAGQARDGRAELQFAATVQLLTDEPVEVPLGLVGAILQGQPRFERAADVPRREEEDGVSTSNRETVGRPPGEYLRYEPDHGGFVTQLAGRSGERRVVSLSLIVPLSRDGPEMTLPLNCPRALSSNLTLTVDTLVTEASVNSGTLLAKERIDHGGTRMSVAGAAGAFRLAWRNGENGAEELATVLSAASSIRVSIDGRSVRSNARLTVQSYGGSFDRFRVRLPPGAQLLRDRPADAEAQSPAYRVTLEDGLRRGADGAGGPPVPRDDARQTVLVELPEKQQGPVVVELSTEQPIGLEGHTTSVELAGFAVLGAVRQFGDVALEVADDWQARWEIGPNVRQVDPRELETELQQAGLVAAFQYDGQPWSLGVRIAARQTRIHVTPKYELECSADEARLTVHLIYQVFGARAFEFRVRMEGWELRGDPLESGGIVDQERILLAADGTLVLPLAQGSSRRAEITFAVRRAVPRDGSRIELPLPVPLADSVGTGELIVRAAADTELRPDLANSTALAPIPETEATDSDAGGNGVELRFRAVLPEAVFVAERISRPREVSTEVAARIDLAQADAQIDERVDYVVRYGPIKDLVFEAPSELQLDEEKIEIALLSSAADGDEELGAGETPLTFASAATDDQSAAPGGPRRLRVALPQPRLGAFALRIRYRVRRPADMSVSGPWPLPLLRPADGRNTVARAVVRAPRNLSVALDSRTEELSWAPAARPIETRDAGSSYEFIADRGELSLPLSVGAMDVNLPSTTTVDRVWVQIWLSGDVRQDRAAFRFRTTGSQATVELPPRTPAEEIEVLVDGAPADVVSRAVGRITVRLPQAEFGNGAAHTLELRSRQPSSQGLITRHRLTPPQLVGTATLSQVYWQIVLPGDQHVIRSPARMTSASRWQWLGSFWGRRPVMSQPELEAWAGASAQPAPAAAQNEYLFTDLAPVLSIELITAPRWLIVLVASAAVLAVVVVWLYLPSPRRAHRTWVLAAIACSIAGLAAAFPVPAMLLAQASVLGVVIAALTVVLTRLMARPSRWPVTLSTGSSQRQITPRADSILMPPIVAAASTAPTAPLRMSDSE